MRLFFFNSRCDSRCEECAHVYLYLNLNTSILLLEKMTERKDSIYYNISSFIFTKHICQNQEQDNEAPYCHCNLSSYQLLANMISQEKHVRSIKIGGKCGVRESAKTAKNRRQEAVLVCSGSPGPGGFDKKLLSHTLGAQKSQIMVLALFLARGQKATFLACVHVAFPLCVRSAPPS